MKKYLIVSIILLIVFDLSAMGWGDWENETPKGNKINNFSGQVLYLKNGIEIFNINEWYFYKNKIIGNLIDNNNKVKYFVVDEISLNVFYFDDKERFQKYKDYNFLNPLIWKRTYDTEWVFFTQSLYIIYILIFIISVPATIFLFFSLYIAIYVEKIDFKSPYTILISLLIIVSLIRYLLDLNPQSF